MSDQDRRSLEQRKRDADAALASGFTGVGALSAAAAGSIGNYAPLGKDAFHKYPNSIYGQFLLNQYKNKLGGLSEDFYQSGEGYSRRIGLAEEPGFYYESPGKVRNRNSGFTRSLVYGPEGYGQSNIAFDADGWVEKADPTKSFDESRIGLPAIDWDATEHSLRNRALEAPLSWNNNVPVFGPDLGGFNRKFGTEPGPDQVRAYTVVPNPNSGRFSQRLLPSVIDDVYSQVRSEAAIEPGDRSAFTKAEAGVIPNRAEMMGPQPTAAGWENKSLAEKVRLMDRMAPGQSSGGNQSAVIWGTTTETPRYEYANTARSISKNPEILVSYFRAPDDLRTDYAYTGNAHSPYVSRYADAVGEYRPGPHWGAAGGAPTANGFMRRKRDIAGDVSWRSDLTEARGAFNLADAQAVQSHLGIPVTGGEGGEALAKAIGSIRQKLDLPSDAAVVDQFARQMPRLGNTTNPRQPAEVRFGSFSADASVSVPPSVRRAYDLPGALEAAGYSATRGGVRDLNQTASLAANAELKSVGRMAGALPLVGAVAGVLDPDAARLFARASQEPNPGERSKLLVDGIATLGTNTAVGTAIGGGLQLGMRALATRAPAIAAEVLPGVARAAVFGGPAAAGLAAYQTADAISEELTGRTLTAHGADAFRASPAGQALRTAVGGRNASEVTPQLIPQARSVPAHTPTGMATVTQTRPNRVGDLGAQGRMYAGQGWGWQSAESYNRLKQQGRLPGSRPQQLLNRGVQAVTNTNWLGFPQQILRKLTGR